MAQRHFLIDGSSLNSTRFEYTLQIVPCVLHMYLWRGLGGICLYILRRRSLSFSPAFIFTCGWCIWGCVRLLFFTQKTCQRFVIRCWFNRFWELSTVIVYCTPDLVLRICNFLFRILAVLSPQLSAVFDGDHLGSLSRVRSDCFNFLDNVHPFNHTSKDDVFSIPTCRIRGCAHKEIRSIDCTISSQAECKAYCLVQNSTLTTLLVCASIWSSHQQSLLF